jgi:hypothetical protein
MGVAIGAVSAIVAGMYGMRAVRLGNEALEPSTIDAPLVGFARAEPIGIRPPAAERR